MATNVKGTSALSPAGSGAVIISTPDTPTNLLEDTSHRTATTLGLTWVVGSSNGADIIYYRISYNLQGDS